MQQKEYKSMTLAPGLLKTDLNRCIIAKGGITYCAFINNGKSVIQQSFCLKIKRV